MKTTHIPEFTEEIREWPDYAPNQIWRRMGPCMAVLLKNQDHRGEGWFVEEFDFGKNGRHIHKREWYVTGADPLVGLDAKFGGRNPRDTFRFVGYAR